MTSRQRVLNAIEHKPVDRVPIDLGCHSSTGISAFAYKNLRDYLGLNSSNIEMTDLVQCLARVDDDIIDMFHIDTKLLWYPQVAPYKYKFRENYEFFVPETFKPVVGEDGMTTVERNGTRLVMPKNGFFFDGGWPDFYSGRMRSNIDILVPEAERIYKDTDKFTIFKQFMAFFGDMDFLCDMYTDPDKVIERQKRSLEESKINMRYMAEQMGDYVQAVALNSDLGAQNGPLCNPDMYAEFVAPYLKEFCKFIKEVSDYKIFLHCCGSVEPLIPQLIDCGIEILNPVQISASNMDPRTLKQKYGDKICFWGGGCNTQQVLNMGSVGDIRSNVKELVGIFGKGSGFVFNQVHNIMGDIAPEKVVAMLEAAYIEGKAVAEI